MKIENKMNFNCVKESLIRWVLGTDGQDGATWVLCDTIPWGEEIEEVISWNDVYGDFSKAFGSRTDEKGKSWDAGIILTNANELERFMSSIIEKTNKVMIVYQGIIDKANSLYIEQENKKKQLIAKNTQLVDDMIMNTDIAYVTNGIIANMFMKEYVDTIFNAIIKDVIADVKECADEEFSDDDVRFAVNRAILKKLGASI
jgi:hypothetical protein